MADDKKGTPGHGEGRHADLMYALGNPTMPAIPFAEAAVPPMMRKLMDIGFSKSEAVEAAPLIVKKLSGMQEATTAEREKQVKLFLGSKGDRMDVVVLTAMAINEIEGRDPATGRPLPHKPTYQV